MSITGSFFRIGNSERVAYGISDEFDESDSPKLITAGSGLFGGIIVKTNGSDNVTLSIYDNGNGLASGDKFLPADVLVRGTKDLWAIGGLDLPYSKGITVEFSGTGASFMVLFVQR